MILSGEGRGLKLEVGYNKETDQSQQEESNPNRNVCTDNQLPWGETCASFLNDKGPLECKTYFVMEGGLKSMPILQVMVIILLEP